MKILVTGSQGFLGSKITEHLLAFGYKVIGVDNNIICDTKGTITSPEWCIERNKILRGNLKNPNFKFIKWDLLSENKFYDSEQEKLYDALNEKIDIIVHCAAIVGVDSHIKDTSLFLKNLQMDERVIRWARGSHLIYFSSSEVYGDQKQEMSVNGDLKISAKLRSNYALEKLFAERIIQSKLKNYTILRPFNVTGPTQNPSNGVLPTFVSLAKRHKDITVYRASQDGFDPKRTFLSIEDFAFAFDFLIRNLKKYNTKIVNIGSRKSYDIYVLAEKIKSKLKSRSEILRRVADGEDNVILNRCPYTTIFDDMNYEPKDIDEIINEIAGG